MPVTRLGEHVKGDGFLMLIQIHMVNVSLAGSSRDFRVEVVRFLTNPPFCKDLAGDRLTQGDTPGCGILLVVSAPTASSRRQVTVCYSDTGWEITAYTELVPWVRSFTKPYPVGCIRGARATTPREAGASPPNPAHGKIRFARRGK